jgi:membrane peptidoglycan carboxypeptidase
MVGYTPSMSTAVWMGSDARLPIKNASGAIIYGSGLPGQIWKEFMDTALAGTPEEPLPSKAIIKGDTGKGVPEPTPTFVPRPTTAAQPAPDTTTTRAPATSAPSTPTGSNGNGNGNGNGGNRYREDGEEEPDGGDGQTTQPPIGTVGPGGGGQPVAPGQSPPGG